MAGDKNSISALKEFHDRRSKAEKSVDEPRYTCDKQTISGFKSQCNYKEFTTEGLGKSKQIAKCDAARQMLMKLGQPVPAEASSSSTASVTKNNVQRSLPDRPKYTLSPETEALAEAFMKKYAHPDKLSYASSRYPPNAENLEVCFNDINFGMKSPNSPKSETLLKRLDREMHSIECFEKVMGEFGLKFCAEQVEVNAEATGVYVVMLKIDFHYMVVGGKGASLGEAVENACRNGLDTFRLYMK